MLDRWTLQWIKPPLKKIASTMVQADIRADQVTITGFAIGMGAVPAIATGHTFLAAALIILNRIADGLDGEIARLTKPTDRGAYLDIVLDFIFYSAVVFAFALADPVANALAASALIFSFMGTGSTFLAFAIIAERRKLHSMTYPNKGFYYLNGLAEGTETIAILLLMTLFPNAFVVLAWSFFTICVITTFTRVVGGAHSLNVEQ